MLVNFPYRAQDNSVHKLAVFKYANLNALNSNYFYKIKHLRKIIC